MAAATFLFVAGAATGLRGQLCLRARTGSVGVPGRTVSESHSRTRHVGGDRRAVAFGLRGPPHFFSPDPGGFGARGFFGIRGALRSLVSIYMVPPARNQEPYARADPGDLDKRAACNLGATVIGPKNLHR